MGCRLKRTDLGSSSSDLGPSSEVTIFVASEVHFTCLTGSFFHLLCEGIRLSNPVNPLFVLTALNVMIMVKNFFFFTSDFCPSDLYRKGCASITSSFVLSCIRKDSILLCKNKERSFLMIPKLV